MLRTMGLALVLALGAVMPAFADAAPQAASVAVGANDSSGEASVAVGAHLLVKLVIAGGTGHSWALDGDAGPELSLADQRTERTAARLGAPQAAVFDFEAQSVGQKELTFNLVPPGGGDAVRSYTLSVTVSE